MVRAGGIALLCKGCRPAAPAGEAADDDYEDMSVEPIAREDSGDYDAIEVVEPNSVKNNIIHGTDSASASGSVESEAPPAESGKAGEPAVIVSPDAGS